MNNLLILTLDSHGVPHRWISWQQACFYYAKNLVAWTLGESTFTYYGGISRITGERSSITAHSIIAIKGKALAAKASTRCRRSTTASCSAATATCAPTAAPSTASFA